MGTDLALDLVPLFRGLTEEQRAELSARADFVEARTGEWLFQAGDPGDSLYLVMSGLIEVVSTGGEVLRTLGRSSVIGEVALLTREPRSASVRIRRDARLLRIGAAAFEGLLEDLTFTRQLLKELGGRLRKSRRLDSERTLPRVVTILSPTGDVEPAEVAAGLALRLEAWGRVSTYPEPQAEESRGEMAEALDRLERDNEWVLLPARRQQATEWQRFALDQADRVIAVGDWPRGGEADLLAHIPGVVDRISAGHEPRHLDLVARRLAGRSVGVVLSGGGARGVAHVGALEALAEAGLVIDRVAGCSMGALIGGLFATGRSFDEMRQILREELVERKPLGDYTIPLVALARGRRAAGMVTRMFGDVMIEDLDLDYFCVTADLVSGRLVTHRSGLLRDFAGASGCLPVMLPPQVHDEQMLVDGGVLNNLPVREMASTGEGPVIAIDVTARYEPHHGAERPRGRRIRSRIRGALTGETAPMPSLPETLVRMIVLGSIDTAEAAEEHADLLIEPDVQAYGLTDFARIAEIDAAGRLAGINKAEEALALC